MRRHRAGPYPPEIVGTVRIAAPGEALSALVKVSVVLTHDVGVCREKLPTDVSQDERQALADGDREQEREPEGRHREKVANDLVQEHWDAPGIWQ